MELSSLVPKKLYNVLVERLKAAEEAVDMSDVPAGLEIRLCPKCRVG